MYALLSPTRYPLIDEWEVWQFAARKSERTIIERVALLRRLGVEVDADPATLRPVDIVRWYASHSEWSDGTICTYHSYLQAWFKWLQLQDHRIDNPMLKVGTPKAPERMPRPVDDHAMITLLKTNMHHRTRVMILLGALGGLRVHEIAKFQGVDIDDSRNCFYVVGKGKSSKMIPLHPVLKTAAETMPKGWWFPSNSTRPGQHIRSKSVSNIIGLVMDRAGVHATAHSLRHWYGTTLLDDGADLRTVQELLRHKSIATTQLYTKVPDIRRHDAVARLDLYRAASLGLSA